MLSKIFILFFLPIFLLIPSLSNFLPYSSSPSSPEPRRKAERAAEKLDMKFQHNKQEDDVIADSTNLSSEPENSDGLPDENQLISEGVYEENVQNSEGVYTDTENSEESSSEMDSEKTDNLGSSIVNEIVEIGLGEERTEAIKQEFHDDMEKARAEGGDWKTDLYDKYMALSEDERRDKEKIGEIISQEFEQMTLEDKLKAMAEAYKYLNMLSGKNY